MVLRAAVTRADLGYTGLAERFISRCGTQQALCDRLKHSRRTGAKWTPAHAATAPRGALLYPRLSREGLEGRFLGLMADLDGKPEGDNSMPGK